MTDLDLFWKLERLSNRQLLDSLHQVLRTKRRALAELTAHLGEIEDRRLQLEAAYSSMFDYCVRHLGMSEDEACRRIDLARLARRFPRLFPLLAAGEVSLSVALLLKPVLSEENEVELLAAIRGASIRQAREIIAGRFPQPDVPSVIRKLPERRGAPGMAAAAQGASRTALRHEVGAPVLPVAVARASAAHPMPPEPRADSSSTEVMTPPIPESVTPVSPPAFAGRGAMPRATATRRDNIEPLSSQRYKIQFTADASVKEKLELARDLLRHACPSGDLNSILSRALDLLIADVKRRKFAVGVRAKMPTQLARQSGSSPATPPSDADCAAPVAEARPTRWASLRRSTIRRSCPMGSPRRASRPSFWNR